MKQMKSQKSLDKSNKDLEILMENQNGPRKENR